MKRFGFKGCGAAIVMLVLAGVVAEAGAAELSQAGFAYGGWGGGAGFAYNGMSGPNSFRYGGPTYGYAGYTGGYAGGYAGGGGWGYNGSCCNNVWAGYCNEMQGCGGCRVGHRHRRLGCGAGPCCQPSCAQPACAQPACQPTVCGPAPCVRRHGCFLRRRHCNAGCGADAGCGCNGGMSMGYDSGMMMMEGGTMVPEGSEPVQPSPMPETIEPPAPKPGLDGST